MRRVLLAILVALPLLLGAAWFGGRAWFARSVADDEEAALPGLTAPVEVTLDSMGVAQIWARTDGDLYAALGWVHASERLFQMELVRRVARGELAEVFGAAAVETDVQQRRIGYRRMAEASAGRLSPAARLRVQRYLDGINAWVASRTGGSRPLPPEFVLLQLEPRPWTLEDVLSIAAYQTWYAHELSDQEERYAGLVAALGDSAAALLNAGFPWSPPTVPDAFLRKTFGAAHPLGMAHSSNAWTVAPERSASGAAIHAADPHLEIHRAPGFWYLVGLHSEEGTEALGVTTAGLPFVAMGHNGQISYSFTVAAVDVVDILRETFFEGDTTRVLTAGGGSAPVEVLREEVRVKGEDQPRRLVVERTPNGVVMEKDATGARVLRWAGFSFPASDVIENGFALMAARDFSAFRRAVTRLGALDVNWAYADRAGHIGYQLGTPIPVRADTTPTFLVRDATDPAAAWRGYRPLGETPYAFDPARGWLATCNNQIVGESWPYLLPGYYDPYRITRASALLAADSSYTREDAEAMQEDRVSAIALRWKFLAAAGAERNGDASLARRLRTWPGTMTEDDSTATIFAFWWHGLARHVFEDEVGERWGEAFDLLEHALTDSTSAHAVRLIDDRRTAARERMLDISGRALEEAVHRAAGRTYGEAHTLTVAHPLAQAGIPGLVSWLRLNRGPYPWGGDPGTLAASFRRLDEARDHFEAEAGPSMRFVMDWADPDAFTIQTALGQSGNPFSPHYADFLDLHRAGRRWTVPFSRAAVFARRASLLRLVPA